MTSQSQIEDEILARRLQSEEYQAASSGNRNYNSSVSTVSPASQVITNAANKPTVKLHQTATGRQIGETLLVNNLAQDEIALELSNRRGYYLKIRDTGVVEFNVPPSGTLDDFFKFRVIVLSNGSCYLMSKAFLQSTNRAGGCGWHLTILPNGQLCGNGPRDSHAEWALLNLQTQLPLYHPAGGYVPSSNVVGSSYPTPASTLLSAGTGLSTPSSSTQFPGLGAGKDELMRFFATPAGSQFLSQSEYLPAQQLYLRNGVLARLLHRPDWPFLASRFRDYLTERVPFQRSVIDQCVSKESLQQFFEQGWTTISNVVTPEAVNNARKIINYWNFKHLGQAMPHHNGVKKGRGYTIELAGDITLDMDLLSLYYLSPLPHIMEELLGEGEVDHAKSCRVLSVYPSLDLTESPALFGDKWTIEGFSANPPAHSPYNILVGIALTDISDTDMGNYCVHSGSHITLLEEYKKKAESRQTIFSDNPYVVQKPDLGPPTQLKLKAGDAFFCTQRLATLLATNTRSEPTTFAFFEISNVDHAVLKEPALQSMWLEYKNASRYLKDENSGIIITPAVAVAEPSHDMLLDFSSIDVNSNKSGTVAYPTTAMTSSYPTASVSTTNTSLPVPAPLARSPSLQEDYAPAMNPMFSNHAPGYSALPAEDDEGPMRASNGVQLKTFASNRK